MSNTVPEQFINLVIDLGRCSGLAVAFWLFVIVVTKKKLFSPDVARDISTIFGMVSVGFSILFILKMVGDYGLSGTMHNIALIWSLSEHKYALIAYGGLLVNVINCVASCVIAFWPHNDQVRRTYRDIYAPTR